MLDVFITSFGTTFQALLQILLVSIAGGILIRKKVITQEHLKSLSTVVVRVLLPCMTFSNIVRNFNPAQFKIWPLVPLVAILTIGLGLLAAITLFWPNLKMNKHHFATASLQNAGYLILPLGKILYPKQFDEFAMYCFLYILGMSPLLWSLGKYLVSSGEDEKISFRGLLTPPLVACIGAIVIVLVRIQFLIPKIVLDSSDLIGSATVPIATFVLGAVLGSISFNIKSHVLDAAKVLFVRLIFVPICTIAVLMLTGLHHTSPLLCSLFVLQSSSSPATGLILQVKHYGGNEQEVGSILMLSYIACIFTIPLWLAVWTMLIG
jgi:predicted permease